MAPFGFLNDGVTEHDENFVDPYGQKWETVKIIKGQ